MNIRKLLLLALLALPSHSAFAFFIPQPVIVQEVVNEISGHYVLLTGNELGDVLKGAAGPGWSLTGHVFSEPDPGLTSGLVPVCRFYSPVNNSHFLTANPDECASLKDPASGWLYEKIAFFVTSRGPTCASGEVPIYRVYNNRAAFHDVNHRFTPDAATRDQMIAAGWIDEGVAWCATAGSIQPIKTYYVVTGTLDDAAGCESRVGSCIRVGGLAPMTNVVQSFLPPSFVNRNPDFPIDVGALTGSPNVDLRTAQPSGDAARILAHSFAQAYVPGTQIYGVHLNGADRIDGASASIDPMSELPGAAPAAGGADERFFPFKGVRHHTLVASFDVIVPTVRVADASSNVSGELILQFGDARTGHSFHVRVGAYGTVPQSDLVTNDATNGTPVVSTSFRVDPAFGKRLAGEFKACIPGIACIPTMTTYSFRMVDTDMAEAIRRARMLDPGLSSDPADYFVGQFRVHNEASGSAELGATVTQPALSVYY